MRNKEEVTAMYETIKHVGHSAGVDTKFLEGMAVCMAWILDHKDGKNAMEDVKTRCEEYKKEMEVSLSNFEPKTLCAECGNAVGNDDGPPDGWQLEDGSTVCHRCCAKSLRGIITQ